MDFVGPRELDVKSSFNLTEANFTPFLGEPKGSKIVTGHAAGGFFASLRLRSGTARSVSVAPERSRRGAEPRQPPKDRDFPEIPSFLVCC